MNNVISISYDKSPKDLTALTSFEFNKDKNVLQMKVGYVGSNAEEIIKIVTEQGYIDEIKAKVRTDAIDECIRKLEEKYSYHEKQIKYPRYDHYCNGIEDCIDVLEGLLEGSK